MLLIISAILVIIWGLILTIGLLWVAFKYPFIMVILYIVIAILPFLFQMTPLYNEDKWALFIGFGIRTSDYLLIVMLIAILIKIFFYRDKQYLIKNSSLYIIVALFAAYFLFEILRNVFKYKIAAFGEFRYTYITFILPVYIIYFFSSNEERIKLFKFVVFTSLILTLLFIPIIGFLKGWDIHPLLDPEKGRFLPSELSLGLFYGLMGLIIGKKYEIFELKNYKIFLITTISVIIILIDNHRSVWLSIVIVFLILFLLRLKKRMLSYRWILSSLILIVIVFLLIGSDANISKFLSERLLAFTNPEQDPTANWRLLNWSFQIEHFFHSPIIGEGFGGYWGFSIYKNDIWIMPHNLYIMILAKLGIIGLILYLGINIKIFLELKNSLRKTTIVNSKQTAIIMLGLISLVGANVYALAYPVDPRYSWLFIGLGLSAVLNKKKDEL